MRIFALISLILLTAALGVGDDLIVHEWGTFTCLQDETGQAIGGINTDDEPVPPFVHNLASTLLIRPTELPPTLFQGVPSCHPDVTMRLETPVIYFHTPKSQAKSSKTDVSVEFHGGWLTQFYPAAEAVAPGIESATKFGHLQSNTIGRLSWPALTVGSDANGPATTEHVWTSPRAVHAASVTATNNESEKFLFYRGVGHIDVPLQIARDSANNQLLLRPRLDLAFRNKQLSIHHLWLAEIRPDGSSAFQKLKPMILQNNAGAVTSVAPATFGDAEFSPKNTALFRADMHRCLVQEGLFDDEADALLNTWELSYFKSAGFRLFFIVPRAWTDYYLPLHISAPAELQRVMVGRIELVTPAQRELLQKISAGPAPDMQSFSRAIQQAQQKLGPNGVSPESSSLASLGVPIPEVYQDYLELGRFRNALVLNEEKRRSTVALRQFIQECDLSAYEIPAP